MLTSLTPSWRIVSRSSCAHSRAWAALRMSGSVTISTRGVPPRLKSTSEDARAVDAARLAHVGELGGVLLQVGAGDADAAEGAR